MTLKRAKILYILLAVIFFTSISAVIIYFIGNYIANKTSPLNLVLALLAITIVLWSAYSLIYFYRYYKSLMERCKENEIMFGEPIIFDNRASFLAKVKRAMRRNKEKNRAIISFSCFSQTEHYQYFQMKIINHYRKEVITYFDLLEREEAFKKRVLSAFDNNNFIVYFEFETNLELNNFINKIERDLYTIYQKEKISISMHPKFGVYLLKNEDRKNLGYAYSLANLSLKVAINNVESVVFYSESFSKESSQNEQLQKEIEEGIKNHEFEVYYQGKFDLNTNSFVGAEALVRWNHPSKGLFSPSQFIDECEKSGLIHLLDFYVFDQVCKDLGDWKKRGRRMIPISTNFSSYDFYRPDFVDSVLKTLEENSVNPLYIEIEVTESSTANNYFYVMSVLKRLQNADMKILMDDFGTGFSSLGNLKKYPINAIKIDKSFIDDIEMDIKSREIVQTIIQLARSLGLQSIAEGVQNEKQVKILRQLKCDQIQGFYYSKPLCKKDFEVFLSTNEFEKKGKR